MKYRIPVSTACILIASAASAQQIWERNYGGAGEDFGNFVQQTPDTAYIVAGSAESFGNGSQVYLVKTNARGDTLWTRTYGGISDEWGECVRRCTDTGYVVVGSTDSYGTGVEVYLVKTNAFGDTQWIRTWGARATIGAIPSSRPQMGVTSLRE